MRVNYSTLLLVVHTGIKITSASWMVCTLLSSIICPQCINNHYCWIVYLLIVITIFVLHIETVQTFSDTNITIFMLNHSLSYIYCIYWISIKHIQIRITIIYVKFHIQNTPDRDFIMSRNHDFKTIGKFFIKYGKMYNINCENFYHKSYHSKMY